MTSLHLEVREERAALEAALSSLAGKLRGRQEEREDIEGRYGWLRSSSKVKRCNRVVLGYAPISSAASACI